jgi:hypothetical protein
MKSGKSTETGVYTGYAVTNVFADPQSVLAFLWAFMLPERLRFARKTDLHRKELGKINSHSKVLYLCKVSWFVGYSHFFAPPFPPLPSPSLANFCVLIILRVAVPASPTSARRSRFCDKTHLHGAEGWENRYN